MCSEITMILSKPKTYEFLGRYNGEILSFLSHCESNDFFRRFDRRIQNVISHSVNGSKFYIIFFVFKNRRIENFRKFLIILIQNTICFLRNILNSVGGNHFAFVQIKYINPIRNFCEIFPRVKFSSKSISYLSLEDF